MKVIIEDLFPGDSIAGTVIATSIEALLHPDWYPEVKLSLCIMLSVLEDKGAFVQEVVVLE